MWSVILSGVFFSYLVLSVSGHNDGNYELSKINFFLVQMTHTCSYRFDINFGKDMTWKLDNTLLFNCFIILSNRYLKR